jgi:hypothetical protein
MLLYLWACNERDSVSYNENISMIWHCMQKDIVNVKSLDRPAYAEDQKFGVCLIPCALAILSVSE